MRTSAFIEAIQRLMQLAAPSQQQMQAAAYINIPGACGVIA